MKLILYHVFGEKFIAVLMLFLMLEAIVIGGVVIFLVVRLIREEFSPPRPHPKK